MNLWLVGMMGAGKSEVGRLVSNQLALGFIDSDIEIAESQGQAVAQIWAQYGEEHFRNLESELIARIADSGGSLVIATGGGAVLRLENRAAMRVSGKVIWLKAAPSVLAARLAEAGDRPLLSGAIVLEDRISDLVGQRTTIYEELADAVVDAGSADLVTVAGLVEKLWNRFQLV